MIVDTDKSIKSGTIVFVTDGDSEKSVKGSLSLVGSVDRSVSPPKFTVTGLIETTARLPDHMVEVRAGRLIVFDVLIDSESFGSDDNRIVYQFSAKNYKVLDINREG